PLTSLTPLTLTLLAMTVTPATASPAATTATTPLLVPLDMSPTSFDDQYRGCGQAMTSALPALNRSEFHLNPLFAQAWTLATAEFRVRPRPSTPLTPAQAIALLAYTSPLPLHRAFNAAVRAAGASGREYRDNFHFKTLHFLLTDALAALKVTQGQRCHHVFRGVRGVRFEAQRGRTVRFGHFASASLVNESSWAFGVDSSFGVDTCQGVAVRDFSFFPREEEVLIPPFESFQVTEVTEVTEVTGVTGVTGVSGVRIGLRSAGSWSRYNCEWLRGDSEGTARG
ncbi:NRT2 ribosyltransferase, partial [Dyaphorophyia castanea]|nr:NRT2 ribosyltransferase [Platysteira castanea]